MDPDERVQRSTMVAGWQVRRTSDGERRRGQELLDRQAIAQFPQGGFEDPAGLGLLDELYQRLDVIGKPHGPVHDLSPLVPSRARRARTRPADTPPVKGTGGRRECIVPCRRTHCSNLLIWQVMGASDPLLMSERVAANRTGVADMPGQNEAWASLTAWSSARGNGAAATAERCPGHEGVPPPGPDPSQPDLRRADQLCVVSAVSPISCTRRAVGAGRGSLGQAGGGRRRGTGTSRRRWSRRVIIEQGSSP